MGGGGCAAGRGQWLGQVEFHFLIVVHFFTVRQECTRQSSLPCARPKARDNAVKLAALRALPCVYIGLLYMVNYLPCASGASRIPVVRACLPKRYTRHILLVLN